MAPLQLTFLGTFSVAWHNQPITHFRSVNVQGLLAFLALEADRAHTRDTLAALFWPEAPTAAARHNLRQALYQLRRRLPETADPPYLQITRHTVRFNPAAACDLDVARFLDGLERRDLTVAETVYAGDLLAGFTCDSLLFEEWLRRQRDRLYRLALNALHDLTAWRLQQGGTAHAAALNSARRQLELEPWREVAHRQLMEALAGMGDRAGALAQFDRCARLLADELGVDPAPETRAVYEAIRAGALPAAGKATTLVPHNLPRQTTPFVGRAAELERLLALLCDPTVPLVTLVGMGGMGKSRLALEAARVLLTQPDQPFVDGIFNVRLAPISDPARLPGAIADAVGLSWQGNSTSYEHLSHFLGDKRVLLLLDNLEHLVADGLPLIATLLADAPGVQLCVTSRQRLVLRGEVSMTVDGLPVDGPDGPLAADAAQLFLHTARRNRGQLVMDARNEQAVVDICQLTEGMPLALLLAASWVDTLSPLQIAAEIRRDLDFLTVEMHDLPPRQRSMRAAYAYSWLMLSDDERVAFARLSVFRGGFTRRAAVAVAQITLPILAQLVRKSLVFYEADNDRYHIHELLRQFGAEYLATGWQTAAARPKEVRHAHSRYYLTAVTARAADIGGVDQKGVLRAFAMDYENVRSAWRWATEHLDLARLGNALNGLFYYYYLSGRELEGVAQFQRTRRRLRRLAAEKEASAAAQDGVDTEAVNMLEARLRNREYELAHLLPNDSLLDAEAMIDRFRAAGATMEEALALNRLAAAAVGRRDVAEALQIYRQQLQLFQTCGDTLQQGFCLTNMAQVGILSGQIEAGLGWARQALALQARQGDRLGASVVHLTLGAYHLLWSGDYAVAASHYDQAYAVGDEMQVAGHLITGVVMSRAFQAFLALLAGEVEEADRLAAETSRLAARKHTPYARALAAGVDGLLAVTRGAYGRAQERAGQALSLSTQPGAAELAQLGLALATAAADQPDQALNIVQLQWTVTVGWQQLPTRSLLLLFLPVVANLLAAAGRAERAAEVMALGRAQPACPHGWWDRLPLLAALDRRLVAALPGGAYGAAQARGAGLSLADTAVSMLTELGELSFQGARQ